MVKTIKITCGKCKKTWICEIPPKFLEAETIVKNIMVCPGCKKR